MNPGLYFIKCSVITLVLIAVLSACVSRTETISVQRVQERTSISIQTPSHTETDLSKKTTLIFLGRLIRIGPEMERLWGLETKEKTYLLKIEADYSRQVFTWQNQQIQIQGQLVNYRGEEAIQVQKMQPIQ